MEQRSAQEVTALLDVAYVLCYGHFPNSENSSRVQKLLKDTKLSIVTTGPHECALPSGALNAVTPPNSPLDISNPFTGEGPSAEDGNPFSEEDGNPFSEEDGNPFSDDVDKSGKSGNPLTDDSNPFGEDEPDNAVDSKDKRDAQPTELELKLQDLKQESHSSTTADEPSSTLHPSSSIDQKQPSVPDIHVEMIPKTVIDPNSALAKAMRLNDAKIVSQSHAKEILSEAFNLTKLDLNRLVEDTLNTKPSPTVELLVEEIRTEGLPVPPASDNYPILFLRARVGREDRFTNFSSTSATNTILQSLTLGIQNMYNDSLFLEVWSATILPPEDPETPTKLDLLGRLMTGSIRLKKDDPRHSKSPKGSFNTSREEHQTDSELDTSHDSSHRSPSPKPTHEDTPEETNDVTKENEMQNGDSVDHTDQSFSLDISDSVSVTSETSTNEPVQTSTPRERSSSFINLEVPNTDDGLQKKKGFRSSFRKKASNLLRSSQSNLRKSNQSLCADSASPDLSRKGSDAHSIMSESSDMSGYSHVDGTPNGKNKLNREKSGSLLSITSLTRRTFSMRLSTKKAINPMKRFGSMRGKKSKDMPGDVTSTNDQKVEPLDAQHQSPVQQTMSSDKIDTMDTSAVGEQDDPSNHDIESIAPLTPRMASRKLLTPRPMRPFKNLKLNLKTKIEGKDESKDLSPTVKSPTEVTAKVRTPNNPLEIQAYLEKIGKDHLQAERLAYAVVPIKSLVGKWTKEGWIPMTVTPTKANEPTHNSTKKKKKKDDKVNEITAVKEIEKDAKVLCRMHVRLALPAPLESELANTVFESYNSTFSKLVNLQIQMVKDLTEYKGTVGVVGNIVLDQLAFFSRVSIYHQQLVAWLVMVEKKPSDSIILLPFLTTVKRGLCEGQYVTTQKHKLGESLSKWVRHILPKEFERLHSSFPINSHILHLPRLENFLRCFNTIEEDSELRILFEREMNLISLPSLTDQLKGALAKNAELWIEALNKEPLPQDAALNLEVAADSPSEESKWHDALRRAAHLTKPIDDFLIVCVYTYQPIFMTEMAVDYLYWVLPKFLTAALHLIHKTHRFALGKIRSLPKAYHPSAAQSIWKILTNISNINKTSVDSQLPIHLIEQDFRTAFSNTVLQWLTLSQMISVEEIENDLLQEEFVAVDPIKGYSHSAVSMVDILKAIMARLKGFCWPGGLRPGVNTLTRIAKQIVLLVTEYTNKVTHAYNTRGGHNDRIPTQVCVVVRNVEHVCDEARQHLTFLATWAEEELQVREELPPEEGADGKELEPEGRNHDLQRQIDYTAEVLLQRCLPKLEQILTQGVSRDSTVFVVENLENALQPIEDRLYFAEPLLYELWSRLFQHASHLKGNFLQGLFRRDIQRLQKALTASYIFLTNPQKVGFQLPDEAVQDYEELIEELKTVGSSTPGLVAKYYNERYAEQCKEIGSNTTPVIVANVIFSKDEGMRVYIAQAPGSARGGALVKARVEPQEWFPNALPQKTKLVKAEQAVFDETLHFYEVPCDGPQDETDEESDGGGALVLQIRTPKLFMGSVVHHEAIVPLATVPRVTDDTQNSIQHLRLPLTRPWSFKNYKSLETLKSRGQDPVAMDFLKAWHARWEGSDDSTTLQDSLKLNANFKRGASMRLSALGSRRRGSVKDLPVK